MSQKLEAEIVRLINKIKTPFSGTTVQNFVDKNSTENKRYHISPFAQISISGIGPVFYIDKKTQKIYTILQRRFKDNFQWWFPGGYVELVPPQCEEYFYDKKSTIKIPSFDKIKQATIDEFYHNAFKYKDWQKAKQEINDPQKLEKIFKRHKLNWPAQLDANWQKAWQREVLEETGIDLNKFLQKIILDFKFNHTLMIGAERDRLTNIDGKFCAFLGELDKAPKIMPDEETEELRWIALDEIYFDAKRKNFFAQENFSINNEENSIKKVSNSTRASQKSSTISAKLTKKNSIDKIVNLYTMTLIEEALHEIICYKIKQISQIKNPISGQEISKFNNPQNLQSFIISQAQKVKLTKYPAICQFLQQKFGVLEISQNICGKNGDKFYNQNLVVCEFLSRNKLDAEKNFILLNKILSL